MTSDIGVATITTRVRRGWLGWIGYQMMRAVRVDVFVDGRHAATYTAADAVADAIEAQADLLALEAVDAP